MGSLGAGAEDFTLLDRSGPPGGSGSGISTTAISSASLQLDLPPLIDGPRGAEQAPLSLVPEQDDDSVLGLVDTQAPLREPSPQSSPRASQQLASRAPVDEAPLSQRSTAQSVGALPVDDMIARYELGDFTGALLIAEAILEEDPAHAVAREYAGTCRDMLMRMYAARIGDLGAAARVLVPPDQITWLSLDHRAGFVLSLFDGMSSVEDILDICGMPRLEALRIIHKLVQEEVIAVG